MVDLWREQKSVRGGDGESESSWPAAMESLGRVSWGAIKNTLVGFDPIGMFPSVAYGLSFTLLERQFYMEKNAMRPGEAHFRVNMMTYILVGEYKHNKYFTHGQPVLVYTREASRHHGNHPELKHKCRSCSVEQQHLIRYKSR